MRKIKNIASFLLCHALLAVGCVEEYTIPDDIQLNYEQELVVEGRVLSGDESVFYVTRTLKLTSAWQKDVVTDARIRVIGMNGYTSDFAEYIEDAKYVLNTGELNPNTLYSVIIEADGETYQSEPQALLSTPDIREVSYKERTDNSISIHVTTEGDEESTRYYMWSYEEDWEFHAQIDFTRFYPDLERKEVIYSEEYYPEVQGTYNPYYYCWGHDESHSINLYTTEDLTINSVKEHELYRVDKGDIRLGYIYSVLLKQWSLTSEAYEYFRLMKLYTEESDGLFTPMPSDVRGNINCTSNPKKGVRGYVIASNIKEKRLFVYQDDFVLDSEGYYVNEQCVDGEPNIEETSKEVIRDLEFKLKQGYVMYNTMKVLNKNVIWYTPECVDCRKTGNARKERPEWWPNDHR